MALVTTIHGPMDEALLVKREPVFEDDREITKATEYWLDGECVHRSVHVHLKQGLFAGGVAANFG